LQRIAVGAQKDGSAISDLNNIMGKGAAQEYMSVLKQIAKDGLPAVDASVEQSIKKFAELESQYQKIKDKIGELFMAAVVGTVKAFGGFKPTQKDDAAEIEAINRKILRERELQDQAAKIKKEAADDISKKEMENAEKINKKRSELIEKEADDIAKKEMENAEKINKKRSELIEKERDVRQGLIDKQAEQISEIRVAPVEAKNSLESIGASLSGNIQSGAIKQLQEAQLKQQEIIAETSKAIERNSQETWRAIRDLAKE
jgi:hypothetical protein